MYTAQRTNPHGVCLSDARVRVPYARAIHAWVRPSRSGRSCSKATTSGYRGKTSAAERSARGEFDSIESCRILRAGSQAGIEIRRGRR